MWVLTFFFIEDEYCSFDIFKIFLYFLWFIDLDTWALDKGGYFCVLGSWVRLEHPDVGVETLEIDVEDFLMVFYDGDELL